MTQNALATQENRSPAGAMLSIRLWTLPEAAASDAQFWKSNAPAVSLTMDLIRASQGRPVATQGRILIVEFTDISAAVSASRRIQWAIQGLGEAENDVSVSAAILLHAHNSQSRPVADNTFLYPLEQAAPGQILLTEETGRLLKDLPALPVTNENQNADGSEFGPWELHWRDSESKANRVSDEHALALLFKQNGMEDPFPPKVETKKEPTEPLWTPTLEIPLPGSHYVTKVVEIPRGPNSRPAVVAAKPQPTSWQIWITRLQLHTRWLAAGAGVLALLVAIVLWMEFRTKTTTDQNSLPTQQPPSIQATTRKPGTPPTTTNSDPDPPKHPDPETTGKKGTSDNSKRGSIAKDKTKSGPGEDTPIVTTVEHPQNDSGQHTAGHKQEPSSRSGCYLSESDYQSILHAADQEFQAQKYDAAAKHYRSVKACDSGNDHANRGLRRALDAGGH